MNYKYIIPLILAFVFILNACTQKTKEKKVEVALEEFSAPIQEEKHQLVDTLAYREKLTAMANGDTTGLWPNNLQAYPLHGAILPFKRIVAYYGNLYSKKMDALGEYAPQEMWDRLNAEVKAWEAADPSTPVQPAIHYIAAVAQERL